MGKKTNYLKNILILPPKRASNETETIRVQEIKILEHLQTNN